MVVFCLNEIEYTLSAQSRKASRKKNKRNSPCQIGLDPVLLTIAPLESRQAEVRNARFPLLFAVLFPT
jgi:hypothetical protein